MVQRFDDDFQGAELATLRQIARDMGVRNPAASLSFKRGEEDSSRAEGNKIHVGKALMVDGALLPADRISFILGHELSHYRWGDTWTPLLNSMTVTGLAAALLANAAGGGLPALVGGVLGAGAELAMGGGVVNAGITGLSTAMMLGFGPLGGAIGGTVGGYLGSVVGGYTGLAAVSKLFEIKSDLHSAAVNNRQSIEGGIRRFQSETADNIYGVGIPLKRPENTWADPLHPPLSFRMGYLNLIKDWFK